MAKEQSLKEAVLKKAFQMTTVKDEKWVEEELTTPKKRVFSNGVHPIQAIRLGTIVNERRSSDKKSAGLALNYFNQLPIIQEKQKEYLKNIKNSTMNIDDLLSRQDESGFTYGKSPTKSS